MSVVSIAEAWPEIGRPFTVDDSTDRMPDDETVELEPGPTAS